MISKWSSKLSKFYDVFCSNTYKILNNVQILARAMFGIQGTLIYKTVLHCLPYIPSHPSSAPYGSNTVDK